MLFSRFYVAIWTKLLNAANVLVSGDSGKGLSGDPPLGLLLEERCVNSAPAWHRGGVTALGPALRWARRSGFTLQGRPWRESTLEVGGCTCTCGGCDIDGFGSDAGSKSREVDNKIVTRAQP